MKKYSKKYRQKIMARRLIFVIILALIVMGACLLIKKIIKKDDNSTYSSIAETELSTTESTQPETPAPTEAPELTLEDKRDIINSSDIYPEELAVFAGKYDQVVDFVYDYPTHKGQIYDIDLKDEVSPDSVPLFIQWDHRWGYTPYGGGLIGYTGCGPTCLSMIAVHLTGNLSFDPLYLADFATAKGYYMPDVGTSWSLFTEGATSLGLTASVIPLSEGKMKQSLDAGRPIILSVKEGDFTKSGHFIVVTGYDDNGFLINDPNSRENSAKHWTFEVLSPQIKNLWEFSLQQ